MRDRSAKNALQNGEVTQSTTSQVDWNNNNRHSSTVQNGTNAIASIDNNELKARQFNLAEASMLDQARVKINSDNSLSATEKTTQLANLNALACAEVKCAAGVSEGDKLYETLAKLQAQGERLKVERGITIVDTLDALGVVSTVTKTTGNGRSKHTSVKEQFAYDNGDAVTDYASSELDGFAKRVNNGAEALTNAALTAISPVIDNLDNKDNGFGFTEHMANETAKNLDNVANYESAVGQSVVDSMTTATYQEAPSYVLDTLLAGVEVVPGVKLAKDSDGTGVDLAKKLSKKDLPNVKGATEQNMIDSLVNTRADIKAPGNATLAVGRDGSGNLTPVRESIPGKISTEDIHAEPQVLKDLADKPKPHTVAVDQIPCSNCTPELANADVKVIIPQNPAKPNNSPKSAAIDAANGKINAQPKEVDLKSVNDGKMPEINVEKNVNSSSTQGIKDNSGGKPVLYNDVYNPDIVANRTIESRELYGFQESGNYVGSFKRPEVADAKLKKIVVNLYKGDLRIDFEGTGSTMDAARWEFKTGELLNGKNHGDNKGKQYINALNKWLVKHPDSSASDKHAAQEMLKDLQNSLKGK